MEIDKTRTMPNGLRQPESMLQPSQRIGDYTITGFLGSGGFGQVYRAQDDFGYTYALKIIPVGPSADPAEVVREFTITQKIHDTTHILRYYPPRFDGSSGDQLVVLPMELMKGSLSLRMADLAALEAEKREELMMNRVFPQICRGLAACHEAGILHLDLKPGNVLYDAEQDVYKLGDFGISGLNRLGDATVTLQASSGTLKYMAPEQAAGGKLDARTDIYSAGLTICEALFGNVYPQYGKGISRRTVEILEKCLERNPDKRYKSAGELLAVLKQPESAVVTNETPVKSPEPAVRKTSIPADYKTTYKKKLGPEEVVHSEFKLLQKIHSTPEVWRNVLRRTEKRWILVDVNETGEDIEIYKSIWLDEQERIKPGRSNYRHPLFFVLFFIIVAGSVGTLFLVAMAIVVGARDNVDNLGYILGACFTAFLGILPASIIMGLFNFHKRRTNIQIRTTYGGDNLVLTPEDAELLLGN